MRDELGVRIEQVLLGLRFPAARWQIVTHADLYGADTLTRQLLDRLPGGCITTARTWSRRSAL